MSLMKIPCMLVAMVGLQIAATPPNPPPSANEEVASTGLEAIVKQRSPPMLVKVICWSAAIVEAAVIVANHNRDSQLARNVLSVLVLQGDPSRIVLSPLFVGGTLLMALGGYIRYRCYRELGKLFTFEMSIRKDHQLVTSGPYSLVRHPGYTGVLCTVAGVVFWHAAPGSWARECGVLDTTFGQVVTGFYFIVVSIIMFGLMKRMAKEDEILEKTFGGDWRNWAARVPYKLFPGLY